MLPNEAWSKMPLNEDMSVCWTREMRDAFFVARPLILNGDIIAARVAFIEKYKKLLSESRANNKIPKYELSLGFDRSMREEALNKALGENLITHEQVKEFLPYKKEENEILQLEE